MQIKRFMHKFAPTYNLTCIELRDGAVCSGGGFLPMSKCLHAWPSNSQMHRQLALMTPQSKTTRKARNASRAARHQICKSLIFIKPRFSNMKEPYSVCYVQREAWSAAINAPERLGGRRSGALSLLHHPVRDKNKMCRIARQVSLCVYCRILFKKSNLRAKMTAQQQSRASWYELGGCSGSTA